jgi:hypothetical protein
MHDQLSTSLVTTDRSRHSAAILAVLVLLTGRCAYAEQQEPWQFAVTPYVWLPSIDATLGFQTGGSGGSAADMSDVLKYLSGAFFLNAEARKGKWGLSFDLVYCDFTKADSKVTNIVLPGRGNEVPINAGTTTGLTGYMFSLMGSYRLQRSSRASFDLLAGARYTHIGATLDWSFTNLIDGLPARAGSAEGGADLWNGVVGVRGNIALGSSRWYVPLYLDGGAGTSRFTWQALLGAGYAFSWGDILLVYRYLSFEQGSNQDVQRLSFSGPALGATFRF